MEFPWAGRTTAAAGAFGAVVEGVAGPSMQSLGHSGAQSEDERRQTGLGGSHTDHYAAWHGYLQQTHRENPLHNISHTSGNGEEGMSSIAGSNFDYMADYVRSDDVHIPLDLMEALQNALKGPEHEAYLAVEAENLAFERATALMSSSLKKIAHSSSNVNSIAAEYLADGAVGNDSNKVSYCVNSILRQITDSLQKRLKVVEDHLRAIYAKMKDVRSSREASGSNSETWSENKVPETWSEYRRTVAEYHSFTNPNLEPGNAATQLLNESVCTTLSEIDKIRVLSDTGKMYKQRIGICCQIALQAVKTVVCVVRPAVQATGIARRAFSQCETEESGSRATPSLHDFRLLADLTHQALNRTEALLCVFFKVVMFFKMAGKQLEYIEHHRTICDHVISHRISFEDYVFGLSQQPININGKLGVRHNEVTRMIDLLTHNKCVMNDFSARIKMLSERSSKEVSGMMDALSFTTENSYRALQTLLETLKNESASHRCQV